MRPGFQASIQTGRPAVAEGPTAKFIKYDVNRLEWP